MTHIEQAKDLLSSLRAAKRALAGEAVSLSFDAYGYVRPSEYREPDVCVRFDAVWWSLQMAINDVSNMLKEWEKEEKDAES